MKTYYIIFIFSISLAFTISSCVKDEDGLSENIQHFLDSLAIDDTQAVSIDKPCVWDKNNFDYSTYNELFTDFDCDDDGEEGFTIVASDYDEDISLSLFFNEKPKAGKYITTFYASFTALNWVKVTYSTDFAEYESAGSDTIYVEKLSGGKYSITLCDVRIENGFNGYYSNGNITMSLSDCP